MGKLELDDGGIAGLRHMLDSREVRSGDLLSMLTTDGWRVGRYEWSRLLADPPVLFWDAQRGVVIRDDDELRWPDERT